MKPFPHTAKELLEALEELQPEPSPLPNDTLASIMFKAGRRSIVRELRQWSERSISPVLREKRGLGRVQRQNP